MANSIIFVMGVSGSGKTTVAALLSDKMNIPFFDADDFHPEKNKVKMNAGQPLTDDDRAAWLQELNNLAFDQAQLKGAIIACSALKEKYRNVLERNIESRYWFFLEGSYDLIFERLQKRKGHYMPASLLQSQFDSLEIPAKAFRIHIEQSPAEIAALIYTQINPETTL